MNFSPCCEAVCEVICGVGLVASAHWPGRPAPRSRRRPPCIWARLQLLATGKSS